MNVSFQCNPEPMNMIESETEKQQSSSNWVCLFWVKAVHG